MNFCSCGLTFTFLTKVLTSNAKRTVDPVPCRCLKILKIETKLQLQRLNFRLEFWDKNLPFHLAPRGLFTYHSINAQFFSKIPYLISYEQIILQEMWFVRLAKLRHKLVQTQFQFDTKIKTTHQIALPNTIFSFRSKAKIRKNVPKHFSTWYE